MADRNFVVGFLLPVLIGFVCLVALFADIPVIGAVWLAIADLEKLSALTLLVLLLWSAALLLQQINLPLYRMLEGYEPPLNLEGLKLADRQRTAWDAAQTELERLDRASDDDPAQLPDYLDKLWQFYRSFPADRSLVLPTSFGNAVRAFETYSDRIYGVDSIPAWPRLSSVIPESYAKSLDAARAEVDFFVNMTFVAALVAGLALLRSVFALLTALDAPYWDALIAPLMFLSAAIVAAAAAWAMYCGAIQRAQGWGELVCSAFDLYLPALAKQLGFDLPDTADERRKFWDAITSQWLYGEIADPASWKTVPPAEPDPFEF